MAKQSALASQKRGARASRSWSDGCGRGAARYAWAALLLLSGCGDCGRASKAPGEASGDKLSETKPGQAKGSPEACRKCEERACHNFARTGVDPMAGCFSNADPAKVKLCSDAVECAHRTGCPYGARGPEQCYCGSAKVEDCYHGKGVDGPCKAQFEAASTKTDAEWVTTHYSDRELALGNAVVLLYCDVGACKRECSL